MFDKLIIYVTIGLAIVALGLAIALKISWSDNRALEVEKIGLQQQLTLKEADLKISIDNSNRMLSEKNRMMAAERDRAEAEQRDAVAAAQINKDIDYAPDGMECTRSDPVQRALRGVWDLEHGGAAQALDRVSAAGRSGNATAVPGAATSAGPANGH